MKLWFTINEKHQLNKTRGICRNRKYGNLLFACVFEEFGTVGCESVGVALCYLLDQQNNHNRLVCFVAVTVVSNTSTA